MSLFHLKILLTVILLVLITSCKDKSKTEQQKDATGITDTLTSTSGKSFLFLTEWFDKVGVHKYDLEKKKYKPVWWHPRENVVMLVYKPGKLPTYFFTADKITSKGNIPAFSGLKLFIISNDLSEIKQIDDIGDGVQFTARWNDDENLELLFTAVDKTIANYVNQYTKVYDHYGKLVDSEIRTFDILKSGFPQLVPPRSPSLSPSGKFGVSFKQDSVFLKSAGSDSLEFVSVMKHNLNKLKWSEDEKYLIISTLDLTNETVKTKNPETSELFIYSLETDSLIGAFGGAGIKNFVTLNDLLIFDNGFNNNCIVSIFDLKKKKIVNTIKTVSGAGLVIIPQI
ncbi:MAG: hypothetical protein IPM14_11545 [bacterium]|nr:hypothetical protein [bacterium]